MSRRLAFWGLLVGMIVLDQATKAWVRDAADGVEGRAIWALWPGVFEIWLQYNTGIAFGLLRGLGPWLAPIAVGIAAGAVWYHVKHAHEPLWGHVTAALLAAGALGNLYDRIFHGRVTDMFYFRLIDFPVFNVADACITVAAALLVLSWIKDALRPTLRQVPETSAPSAE